MKDKRVRLAIAPIAWTNDDLPELGGGNTFEQCISEMALAGYEGSEVGNKYPGTRRSSSITWTCAASPSATHGSAPS